MSGSGLTQRLPGSRRFFLESFLRSFRPSREGRDFFSMIACRLARPFRAKSSGKNEGMVLFSHAPRIRALVSLRNCAAATAPCRPCRTGMSSSKSHVWHYILFYFASAIGARMKLQESLSEMEGHARNRAAQVQRRHCFRCHSPSTPRGNRLPFWKVAHSRCGVLWDRSGAIFGKYVCCRRGHAGLTFSL